MALVVLISSPAFSEEIKFNPMHLPTGLNSVERKLAVEHKSIIFALTADFNGLRLYGEKTMELVCQINDGKPATAARCQQLSLFHLAKAGIEDKLSLYLKAKRYLDRVDESLAPGEKLKSTI